MAGDIVLRKAVLTSLLKQESPQTEPISSEHYAWLLLPVIIVLLGVLSVCPRINPSMSSLSP